MEPAKKMEEYKELDDPVEEVYRIREDIQL